MHSGGTKGEGRESLKAASVYWFVTRTFSSIKEVPQPWRARKSTPQPRAEPSLFRAPRPALRPRRCTILC